MTCKTCIHFRPHYIRSGRRYHEIVDGHCVYPRLKIRRATTPACPHYQPRADETKSGQPF